MPITWGMSAEENYTSALAATIDAGTQPAGTFKPEQRDMGQGYDRTRRNIVYPVIQYLGDGVDTATNDTGLTLWDGANALAPGATYGKQGNRNLSIATKNLDTGVVTFHDTFDITKLVPTGIGGGDGTWARYVSDTQRTDNTPLLTDPRTGDVFLHVQSCELHHLKASESYAQSISPARPTSDDSANLLPIGLNDRWVFVMENIVNEDAVTTQVVKLHLVPRVRTAEEITLDAKQIYATFTMPVNTFDHVFRYCMGQDGHLYILSGFTSGGGSGFKVWRFDEPTSAPLGGPTVGGGFTDVTAWAAGNGPNPHDTSVTLDLHETSGPDLNRLMLYDFHDGGSMVALTWIFGDDFEDEDVGHQALSATYFSRGGAGFTHHAALVTRYMGGNWQPAASAAAAKFKVIRSRDCDIDLQYHDVSFAGVDYRRRWICFECELNPASEEDQARRAVFVLYEFRGTARPKVLLVLDEAGWDASQPTFAAAIDPELPVQGVMKPVEQFDIGFRPSDAPITDVGQSLTTGAIWMSGFTNNGRPDFPQNNAYLLDPAKAGRLARSDDYGPPFVKLFWSFRRLVQASVRLGQPPTTTPVLPPPPPPPPPDHGNDGPGAVDPPEGGIATTPATFAARLAAAVAGDILALAPGDYGTQLSALNGVNKGTGAGVVIQGVAGVTCRNISLQSCVGLHFKYIDAASETATPSNVVDCSHCSYDHVTIKQGLLPENRSTGIGVIGVCDHISVTSCDISQVDNGIIVAGGSAGVGADRTKMTDITIGGEGKGNRIQKFMGNALFFQVGTRIYGGYNVATNQDYEDGHGDFGQITEVDYATAEYNYCDARRGIDVIQGFVFTERCNHLTVVGNCSFGAIGNGCQISAGTHVLVDDNFWQGTVDNSSGQSSSGLVIRDACDDVTITNNVTNFVNVYNGGGTNTNVHMPVSPAAGFNRIIASANTKNSLSDLQAWLDLHPTVNRPTGV